MGAFKKMIGDAGLGCPSGHFAFGFMPTEKVLDDAGALGVRYVVSSVLPPQRPNSDGHLKNGNLGAIMQMMNHLTADDFKRDGGASKRDRREREEAWSGVCVSQSQCGVSQIAGWERQGYEILLKETDPELVKLEIDAGWVAAGERRPGGADCGECRASAANALQGFQHGNAADQ